MKEKRSLKFKIALFPEEKRIWDLAAEAEHKSLAEFIRSKVNDYVFRKETEKVNVDLGPIMQELKDLQGLITKRDDILDLSRQMVIENAAALNITDATLEEKIISHLGKRSLFTNQIVDFLQEDADIVVPLLAHMAKEGTLTHDRQGRWIHHDKNMDKGSD